MPWYLFADAEYNSMTESSMKRAVKKAISEKRKNILLHSADKDLMKSLSILLQDQYGIVATETVEQLTLQRNNKCISLLVVDLERSIPALLAEFEQRRLENHDAPIIVLYAFRQGQPEWEKKIRQLASQVFYKPVQIEQILEAISAEGTLRKVPETK
jgi:DNA-binding NtrC family response regulator